MNLNNSDQALQAAAALTNALIENDSWNYDGDNTYDLAAAGYDAAVRDALPGVTGSQPVLFVFSAGNAGDGNDDINADAGQPDSIQSPATAKDVLTVGATEEERDITNLVTVWTGATGAVWYAETHDSTRAAFFSSRGNVGIGIEGNMGGSSRTWWRRARSLFPRAPAIGTPGRMRVFRTTRRTSPNIPIRGSLRGRLRC